MDLLGNDLIIKVYGWTYNSTNVYLSLPVV